MSQRRESRALPERVHLPSGDVVRLSDRRARTAAEQLGVRRLARAFDVLRAEGVVTSDDGGARDVLAMPVRDGNVLRALLAWSGVVAEPEEDYACAHCGAALRVAPSTRLEIAPFVDGELDDPELDAPFPFGEDLPIPPVRLVGTTARTVRIATRTVEEALPLAALARSGALTITPAVVAAMGIAALGRERRATVVARALQRAPERAFAAVLDHVHDAHYPRRLVALCRCAECGARNDLDVPAERELPRGALASRAKGGRGRAPTLAAFEARVRELAEEIYGALGVRGVALVVDDGVPACDDGGEPLLGAYTPGGPDAVGIEQPPEVRLYYRTFVDEAAHDAGFDVDAEIRETIEHELTHCLNDLAGTDPLDAEERSAIARDEARHVGRREVARRARRELGQSVAGFVRTTWPIWILVAVATLVAILADSAGR